MSRAMLSVFSIGKAAAVRCALRSLALLLPCLATFLAVLIPSPAPSHAADADIGKSIDEIIDGPDYKHASFGILVVDGKTGETVYRRNPDTMMAPASVTKLFTCAAAIIALGPPMQGTLRGDLILVASGDLTMGGRTDNNGKTRFTNKDHTYANAGSPETELTDTDPLAGLDALAKQVKASGI